jgi:poly(A) polymerase
MRREHWKRIVAVGVVIALALTGIAGALYFSRSPPATAPSDCASSATAPETVTPGWQASYRAGCRDAAGNSMGGSELMHLVAHDGMLFAAVGFWEDTANINYGGTNSSQGWAQILRLDSPGGQWAVDLNMKGVVRPDILDSVTFTTNGAGEPLDQPVSLLITAACMGNAGADLYTRNDTSGLWTTSKIVPGPTGSGCDARADAVYQDPVTGVDRLFVSLGDLGVYSGVYDPTAPGDILWNSTSESGRVAVRPLAIVEANGDLFASSGALVYERVNGPVPTWKVIANESDLPGGTAVDPAVGGIRGLTAVPDPNGSGQSLLFLWVPGNESMGDIVRLDPNGSGGYATTIETSLSPIVSNYLNASAAVVLGAYNNILPVTDPASGDVDYIIGLQTWVSSKSGLPTMGWGNASGGTYAGALYAIRSSNGNYSAGEVNGRFPAGNPPLEAIRCYAISPFPSDRGNVIYFGGYDADDHLCNDTAWIFSTSLSNALQEGDDF